MDMSDRPNAGPDDLPLEVVRREPAAQGGIKRRSPLWLALPLLALVVALGLWALDAFQGRLPLTAENTPPAAPAAPLPSVVYGLGHLVPASGVIAVAPPFGAGDARISALRVREGDQVKAGDILAVLDSEAALKAAIESQRAEVAVQEAVLAQVKQATAASRAETAATVDSARTALDTAQADFERTEILVKRGVAARATLDQKRSALAAAQGNLERAQATLTRFDEAQASGRQDVTVAERRLAAAQAALKRGEADLEKAYVRAPMAGTILTLENEAGERPGPDGLASMADLSLMTAKIDVYQTSIARVSLAMPVILSSDALPAPLSGRVSRIGLQVEKQTSVDASPAANTDARVVEVTVNIDEQSAALARRFTGLQVTARFDAATSP